MRALKEMGGVRITTIQNDHDDADAQQEEQTRKRYEPLCYFQHVKAPISLHAMKARQAIAVA